MRRLASILLALSPLLVWGQQGFRIAGLNTENFFDCTDDPQKEDDLFLPQSPKRWNGHRLWTKAQNISKELISLGNNAPADIIALTEVENDSVMRLLTRKALLRRAGYKYVMTDSKDKRGIDVAILYQEGTFKLLKHQSVPVIFDRETRPIATRDILYAHGVTYTGDTLHIYVCHLSSKLKGRKRTERYRIQELASVKAHIGKVRSTSPDAKIILLGDFNESPEEKAVSSFASIIHSNAAPIDPTRFYNMASLQNSPPSIMGTYKYKGKWEMLDQIIVSGNLLDPNRNFHTQPALFHIHAPKFILTEDKNYDGYMPFRTYNGYKYQGGFSDHLPVYLDFITR